MSERRRRGGAARRLSLEERQHLFPWGDRPRGHGEPGADPELDPELDPDAPPAEDLGSLGAVFDGSSEIVVADGAVTIRSFETRAPEVVRYFENRARVGPDGEIQIPSALLDRALRVGVLALGNADVSVNVDYVDKEFQRLAARLDTFLEYRVRELNETFEEVFSEDHGRLGQALQDYLGDGGELSALFDPDRRDSAIGRMRELMRDHFDGEGSKLYRLLDITDPRSPLTKWQRELKEQFNGLRRLIEDYRAEHKEQRAAEQARAAEREKGALKGHDFEEQAFVALAEIADVFGDSAEATGAQAATGGRKLGDVVVTVNERDTRGAQLRMVFEAKDRPVGQRPILRELAGAAKNRGAVAAVAVFGRAEHMPTGSAPFREYGNARYLCLYDKEQPEDRLALQLAYRVARFWALADLMPDAAEVDTRGIREDVDAARTLMKDFSSIKRQVTRVRDSVTGGLAQLEGQLDAMREKLATVFDRIDGRVRDALASDSGADSESDSGSGAD